MKVVQEEPAEGWYTDPFGRHEARWMSAGAPTRLVRDAGVDSFDAPPDEPPTLQATRIEHPEAQRGGDLRRADSAQTGKPFDEKDSLVAMLDGFAQSTPLS